MRRLWERLFIADRSVLRRSLFAVACSFVGFGVALLLYRTTGFYFTFVIIVTVMAISLYAGVTLAILFAGALSIVADYAFIPPVGAVLNSRAGVEHFVIIVMTAILVAFLTASARRAFHEVARSRADMERMLALVAHDVRNPLATAKMAVQVLFEPIGDKQRQARAVMLRNLEQADGMIQSLLDVASIRAGRMIPLEFKHCDLRDEIGRMVAPLGPRVRVEVRADDPIVGEWSPPGLLRALQNLVANALKYGAAAAAVVVCLQRENDRALLSVHNDGPPIPAADRRAIFQPFQRTQRGIQSGRKGWGLGLSIVQAVAEAHGGRVRLESQEKIGTTFTLVLPIRETPT